MEQVRKIIAQRNEIFIGKASGLLLALILKTRFKVKEFAPLSGGAYRKLPQFLASKRAIINEQNKVNRCFAYAVLSAMHPVNANAHRPQYYDHLFARRGLDKVHYPVTVDTIPEMEDLLKTNINLYTFKDD